MTYLLVYAALLLGGFLTYRRPPARRALYFVFLVGLFVFVGFRYEVGCDWSGYLNIFEIQRYATFAEALQQSEPAFWVANDLLHFYKLDYPYINVIAAAVFFAGLHALARRQPDPLGFLILAFPVLILNLAMSGIRQAMALGFLCVAYNAFVDRRLVRYVILVICASGFHSSALSFLLFAPLVYGDFSRQKIALAGVLALPGAYIMLSGETFALYSERYIESGLDAAGAAFRAGLLALTGVVFLWFLNSRWNVTSPRDHKLVLIGSYLMVAIFPVVFLSSVIGDRFGYYLNPIQLMVLARLPVLIGGRDASLIAFAPYAASGLVLVVWAELSHHFNLCYVPYQLWR